MVLYQAMGLHMPRRLQHRRRRPLPHRVALRRLTGPVLIATVELLRRRLHPQEVDDPSRKAPRAVVPLRRRLHHGDQTGRGLCIGSQRRRKNQRRRDPVSMLLLRCQMPVNTPMSKPLVPRLDQLLPRDLRKHPSKSRKRNLQGIGLAYHLLLLARG